MSKEIRMVTLNRIKYCLLRIFEAEDDDIPNRKIIGANNRALDYYLKDYSETEKDELLRLIRWTNDDNASNLEKHGWRVIREKNKNERKN